MGYILTHYWSELIQDSDIRCYQCDCFGIQYDHRNNVCYLWSFAKSYDAHHWSSLYWNFPEHSIVSYCDVLLRDHSNVCCKIDGFTAGTIGLTIYTSSFIAETVRAGIQSVDPGQMEGARANGMTYWQAMSKIVLPQAFKIIIPPLGNQFINLVKNSSVLAFVAGFDLMYQANSIASLSLDTINSYVVVGVFYLIITLPLSYYMRHLEKKLAN